MKYIVHRVICHFSNGSKHIINYANKPVTEENACNDIEVYRKGLIEKFNKSLSILNVHVESVLLAYEEIDGRQ